MRYIYSDIYTNFKCAAGKCIYTCCGRDWGIIVDQETYKKYEKLDREKGTDICGHIKKRDGEYFIELNGGRCFFLNNDGLCNICLNVSPEYLSYTCDNYPRIFTNYDDVVSVTNMLSCPEVVKMILESHKPIQIDYMEDEERLGKEERNLKLEIVIQGLIATIDILQLDSVALKTKVYAVLVLNKYIEDALGAGLELSVILDTIEEYKTTWIHDEEIINFGSSSEQLHGVWEFIYTIFERIESMDNVVSDCIELISVYKTICRDDDYKYIKTKMMIEKTEEDINNENILVNFILGRYLKCYESGNMSGVIIKGVLLLIFAMAIKVLYTLQDQCEKLDDKCLLVSKVAILFDNTKVFDYLIDDIKSRNSEEMITMLIYAI